MSFGKGSSTTIPELTPEQRAYVKAQSDFFTNVISPTYQDIVKGATDVYKQNLPGTMAAAQNLGGVAGQVQQTLGETGESALRTGVTGLQNLFGRDYEAQQIQAALAPSQAMYQQNVANQGAMFGGAGQLGSARQALAGQQLAGQTAAQQAATAAQVSQGVAQQRADAARSLMGYGGQALPGALSAAGQFVGASQIPMAEYGRYASIPFGTPSASYTNIGPTGQTQTGKSMGVKLPMSF